MDPKPIGRTLWHLLTRNRSQLRKHQARFLDRAGPIRILEIGSGKLRDGVAFQSAVDLVPDGAEFVMSDLNPEHGHTVIDITRPDADLSKFDAILCCNVLEHVLDLHAALAGLEELIHDDGLVFVSTPFAYPLHDEPADYWRPTEHALRELFSRHWKHVHIEVTGLRQFPFQVFVTAQGKIAQQDVTG